MLDIEKDTARTIIDALAVAIDGKPSSAKNFNQFPYEYPADCDQQGTQGNGRRYGPRPEASTAGSNTCGSLGCPFALRTWLSSLVG